jgi:transcriptional regulator with XRE-family HTH domain
VSTAFFDELQARYGDVDAFIKRTRSKMVLHGISQSRLAERAGFQPIRISEWFNRRVDPSLESMVTVDEALECLIRGE